MVAERFKKDKKWTEEYKEELKDNFYDYFDKTTVHGLRYLTEKRRPWPEKVLWFIGITLALVACIWLMYKTCIRWVDSPVIIAMDESQRAVWQIPFPAVTICPQAKVNSRMNLTQVLRKYRRGLLTEEEEDLLEKIQAPCKIPLVADNGRNNEDSDPTDAIEDLALGIEEVITTAIIRSTDAPFQPILTEEGLCYSFNMMPAAQFFRNGTFHALRDKYLKYDVGAVQWDPSRGYKEKSGGDAYPFRALGAGKHPGLNLHLHTNIDFLHSVCNFLGQGFQLLLHSPVEFPEFGRQSVFVPLDSVVQLAISPTELRTSKDLRAHYTPEERQCFFADERRLQFFLHYTQGNCELECLANLTLWACGCVEFYMPRMPDTPVCGMEKKDCAKRQADAMNEVAAGILSSTPEDKKQSRANHPCGCMQSCMEIQYQSDRSRTELDLASLDRYVKQQDSRESEPRQDNEARSIVFIYYKDSHYIPIRRVEVFGTADLLASLGGVMGLCMGISLLSVIEFFYWLLVRPCCQRIKQSDPLLRSVKKNYRTQGVEAAVQYSRYLEDQPQAQTQPSPNP